MSGEASIGRAVPDSDRRPLRAARSAERVRKIDAASLLVTRVGGRPRSLSRKRVRTDRLRRNLRGVRKARSQTSNRLAASLRTDLALSRLAFAKQTATLSEVQADIDILKSKLAAVTDELECPICKESLARPLAVYPCGHVFCEECLLHTFCTPRPHEDPEITHATRPKYCPDCRSHIQAPPVPLYLVRNVLNVVSSQTAGGERNSFGNLGLDLAEGEDPWSLLFPDDYTDAITLGSDSDGDDVTVPGMVLSDQLTELERTTGVVEGPRWPEGSVAGTDHLEPDGEDRFVPTFLMDDLGSLASTGSTTTEGISEDSSSISSNDTFRESVDSDGPWISHSERRFGTMDVDTNESSEESEAEQVASQLSTVLATFDSESEHSETFDRVDVLAIYRMFYSVNPEVQNPIWVRQSLRSPNKRLSREQQRHFTQLERTMHRRGVSISMMDKFNIGYSRSTGLKAIIANDGQRSNVIYLGWNIEVAPSDPDGEIFMEYIRWEMICYPERWSVVPYADGHWEAYRLKPIEPRSGEDAWVTYPDSEDSGSETE